MGEDFFHFSIPPLLPCRRYWRRFGRAADTFGYLSISGFITREMHLHSRFGGFRELVGLLAHLYVGRSFACSLLPGKLGNSQSLRDKLGHENDAKLQHRVPRPPLLLPAAGALEGTAAANSEVR